MQKIKFLHKRISILIFSLLFLMLNIMYVNCAASDESTTSVLNDAEEKIQNPILKTEKTIDLYSPTLDSIKTINNLTFKLYECSKLQYILIANGRFLIENNSIKNINEVLIARKIIDLNNSDESINITNSLITIPITSFDKIVNGELTDETLSLSAERYYWSSYSYNKYGELICSSPQFSFYLQGVL